MSEVTLVVRGGLGAVALALALSAPALPARAGTAGAVSTAGTRAGDAGTTGATMTVSVGGRAVSTLTPGRHIAVTVRGLPPARRPYCLGLASAIDRYSLPVSLGHVDRDARGTGHIAAVVPPRLFPAEPAGPYLLFVGTCTPIAPDRPFVARTTVSIVPA